MHSRKSTAGFTMLEVLIAIVVIAFGLLGVAGLQVLALKNNQSASYRLIATTLANDMIDRIKTNAVGADEGHYNSTDPNAYTTQVAACLTAAGCTPQQLAQNDRFEWAQLLAAALPGGRGDRLSRRHTRRRYQCVSARMRRCAELDSLRGEDLVERRPQPRRRSDQATAFLLGIRSMKSHLLTRGFTLVEVMVAIAIGLFLTAVIANLFVNSRSAYNTTDEISRMQENMRFAYQLLARTVHLTGYRNTVTVPASGLNGTFVGGAIALDGTNDNVNGSDTLTIRYQGSGNGAPDGSIVDCTGAEIRADQIVTNVFSIRPRQNGRLALFCEPGIVGGAAVPPVEIVPDVRAMHILYGEETDAGTLTDYVADRYVPRNGVGNMDSVRLRSNRPAL